MKDLKDKVTPEFPEVLQTEGRDTYPDMEGDFTYLDNEGFEREPDFMGRLDDGRVNEAYEESHFHFTLMAFEDLLSEHGLPYLLDHMSKDTVFELLRQAHRISHD